MLRSDWSSDVCSSVLPPVVSPTLGGSKFVYTSGGSCGRACNIPPKSRGHLPPVGQRCLPAVLWVVYLRSSVLAGRCLPAVLTSTCGAFGMFTSGGAEMFMPDGMGCIPPVVSPTLGGSKFVYTSGGSCGRACNTRPRIGTSTCGATDNYLRC